jgi:phosphomannomutase
MEKLSHKAHFQLHGLFLNPDGNFPNHHPNPMLEKNREYAKRELLGKNGDVAFIFDGDADRIILLDDTGEVITSGILSSVITHEISKKYINAGYV